MLLFGWIDSGSLSLDSIGYVVPLLTAGAVMGAALSLPVALPTIIFTEVTRFHSFWVFLFAGFLTGVVIISMISDFTLAEILTFPPYFVRDLVVMMSVSTTASCTYWLFAWRLFPPKAAQA